MNCIAIDDEPRALEVIENYIGKIDFLKLTARFRDPFGAIDYLINNDIDLIFLDINMPGISGMDLAKVLKDQPMLIFTTAYSEYAIESYKLNAIDYLLKPFEFERFLQAVIKAKELHSLKHGAIKVGLNPTEPENKSIHIKSGTETHHLRINTIKYVEGMGNYITVYAGDRKIITYSSLKDFLDKLPERQFVRVHKSYIVSLEHLQSHENHQVKLDGKTIPIGKNYREMFFELLNITRK